MKEFSPKYDFNNAEAKWQKVWEDNKLYEAKVDKTKKKYSVVIPPPNITGILHIGHMLNNTLQDIFCRWKRMQGYEVCWVPGIDHAGISTQHVLERELNSQGKTRDDIGREAFVKMGWEWKEKYGGIILKQLRKLGVSVDWSKERFTLDEGLNKAVREVFVDLYKKGLIYRGKRIVNWDPKAQTAVSDDEIEYKEKRDKLYFIKYYIAGTDKFVTVATTRPETMFGDTAVAVNPEDERYKSLGEVNVILPLADKEIPLIRDSYVDKEFGTGALKVTPAHDINDFEIGQRHNLETINVLNKDSTLNEYGLEFKGMDIFVARKKIVAKLQELNLIEKIEELTHNVSYASKSGAVIEPYLSDQWFVSMKPLAKPALKVVNDGQIKFHPERWVKTYNHWMENVRDWCISRQLWWGHQIPIWYHNETGEIYCETEPPKDLENWTQDPDVLDTWFSSWLWPFSVFGWENDKEKDSANEQLNYFYPTDFLGTAADIIFLWVARMIMAGLEYMGEIPFKDVYFNSIVRDGQGRKMSKTLGNSPDPLDVIQKYGADSMRFTLIYLAPLGNDVLYDETNTEIGRNFITKLWNAGRFIAMNNEKYTDSLSDAEYKEDIIDEWITSRLNTSLKSIEDNLKAFRLNDYSKQIYNFVWSDFCDWYIELIKIKANHKPENAKQIFEKGRENYLTILKILHPIAPVVTEELWHIFNDIEDTNSISFETFPEMNESKINLKVENEFESLQELVTGIRNLRAENNIPNSKKCKIFVSKMNDVISELNADIYSYIKELCNLDELNSNTKPEGNYASKILPDYEIYLSLEGLVDKAKQKEKLEKELDNLTKFYNTLDKKLSNEGFLAKAAPQVIETEKEKQNNAKIQIEKLKEALESL
ncbi:MAG: valine--tRNA ligase [Ignavibacteria bacterium]|nr:valine--tRNA ligase [Ignavibacteria bacterium]